MQQRQRITTLGILAGTFLAIGCDRATTPTETPERPTVGAAGPSADVISETNWGFAGDEVTQGAAVGPDGSSYLAGFTTSFGPERVSGSTIWLTQFDGIAWDGLP
jgi:hypothetical protein